MLHKSSEKNDMSEIAWASERLQEDIAPRGSVKERIRDAALTLKWKHSRTRTIWYADERASIKPKELRRIEEVTGIAYGREELNSVETLIARADALASLHEDESVYSAFATALRAFSRVVYRTGTRGDGQ